MLRSLVGSEMCIRDSRAYLLQAGESRVGLIVHLVLLSPCDSCLLYTSDAADDLTRVDIGGRRFFQAEDGIRDAQESRGLGDVYKRQPRISAPGGRVSGRADRSSRSPISL